MNHTPTPHPTETPEYWLRLARDERAFAAEDRSRRRGSVESIRIHEANATSYEARAAALALRTAEDVMSNRAHMRQV